MKAGATQDELRVSTLELFFDLVFVFAITQRTALVEQHLSLLGQRPRQLHAPLSRNLTHGGTPEPEPEPG